MNILGVYREEVFSPQRESDDAAILSLTGEALRRRGFNLELAVPEGLETCLAHEMPVPGYRRNAKNERVLPCCRLRV